LGDDHLALPTFMTLLGICVVAKLSGVINHDTGWYLYSAEAFLNGGRLYQDIFWEVNPPITLYLTIPPVWLGMTFGGSIPHWFLGYVFVLISGSLLLVNHILRSLKGLSVAGRRMVLLFIFFGLAILPAGAFGQREHLMMILIMPYVFLTALRASGCALSSSLEGVAGILGGLGFVLKPYFLLGPILIEFFIFFQRRKFIGIIRGETLGLTMAASLCGLAVLLFTPEYVDTVVPFALKVYNSAYRGSVLYVVSQLETILIPVILILHLLTRKKQRFPYLSSAFLVLALGFFCIYLFQMKGWSYHIYPVAVLLLLALAVMILGISAPSLSLICSRDSRIFNTQFLIMIGLIILMVFLPLRKGGYVNSFTSRLFPIVEQHASGKWIYILSADVATGFPLVNYTEAKWSSRFPALWLLPGLIKARYGKGRRAITSDSESLNEIEHFSLEAVISDFTSKPPTLVIVDVRQKKTFFGGVEFDYLKYFSANQKFKDLWAMYAMIADLGDFQVFKRRCSFPCESSTLAKQ